MEILRTTEEMKRQGWFIYALLDPDTEQIRYVGQTRNLRQRYQNHLHPNVKRMQPVISWIQHLRYHGKRPLLAILEETDEARYLWDEMYWIGECRREGPILNRTICGGAYKQLIAEDALVHWDG
jgi:hypothetical protein